jgi:hypothetical protein
VTEKPKTRAELEATIAQLSAGYERFREDILLARKEQKQAETLEKETRGQFNDLKQRLVTAEFENQRMRGYLARVQEDDVVREELVRVGAPEGECLLVPKRKPTAFEQPGQFQLSTNDMAGSGAMYHDRSHAKPKHWVTY